MQELNFSEEEINRLEIFNKGGYEGKILVYNKDLVIKRFEPYLKGFIDFDLKKYKLEEFHKKKLSDNILAIPKKLVNVNNDFAGFMMKKYNAITINKIEEFSKLLEIYEKLFNNLEYLHQKNIIIGDIKYDNIIVDNGNPVFVDVDSMGINDLKQDHICNVPKGLATKIPGIHAKMDLNDYKKMDKMLLFACFINSLTNERETLTSKILNSKLNEESKELFYNYLINNDIDYNFDIQGLIGKERGNM